MTLTGNSVRALPANEERGRRDERGRARRGSQLHTQIWVNCRTEAFSSAVLGALGLHQAADTIQWKSPLSTNGYREYRDAAFLRAIDQSAQLAQLKQFWPTGGPVWDAIGTAPRNGTARQVFLVEGKSYPNEVYGRGCMATVDSDARRTIESSLNATAKWLGVQKTEHCLGKLYQSANRIAHAHLLRETLDLDAFLVNVCFADDEHRRTSAATWKEAHTRLRGELGIDGLSIPWLADVVLPAGSRAELLAIST
jgi:hypothetical protein